MAQRELTRDEIELLMREQRTIRVAFSVPGRLYLLPLGYVWLDGALHLMTTAGQKTEMASASGRADLRSALAARNWENSIASGSVTAAHDAMPTKASPLRNPVTDRHARANASGFSLRVGASTTTSSGKEKLKRQRHSGAIHRAKLSEHC